jgi:hypothetical protein
VPPLSTQRSSPAILAPRFLLLRRPGPRESAFARRLTQLSASDTLPGRGGLPGGSPRIRGALLERRGLPCVPCPASLAGGIPLSAVRPRSGLPDPEHVLPVLPVLPPSVRHRRHDLSGRPEAPATVVPSRLVPHESGERRQRSCARAGPRNRELRHHLDEFTSRFKRRTSRSRGKLFYRLLEQAMQSAPAPYSTLSKRIRSGPERRPRRRKSRVD